MDRCLVSFLHDLNFNWGIDTNFDEVKMSFEKSKRLKETFCPYCSKKLDAAFSQSEPDAIPIAGDVTVCSGCLEISEFDSDLNLKKVDIMTLPMDIVRELNQAQILGKRAKDFLKNKECEK